MTFRMEGALDVTQPISHLQTRRRRPRSGTPTPNPQFLLCGAAPGHHPLSVSVRTPPPRLFSPLVAGLDGEAPCVSSCLS